jgi:hypothetical protein
LIQKEAVDAVGVLPFNFSKMEKGERESGIEVIDMLVNYFELNIDKLVYPNNNQGKEVK